MSPHERELYQSIRRVERLRYSLAVVVACGGLGLLAVALVGVVAAVRLLTGW